MTAEEMLNKDFTYAVVGASNNPDKFGFRVLKDLHDSGYNVIPVNIHEDKVMDLQSYHTISDYPGRIDAVIFVVPPPATEAVLEEVQKLGIKNVWMQPGSQSEEAVTFCKDNKINYIEDDCVMVRRKKEN